MARSTYPCRKIYSSRNVLQIWLSLTNILLVGFFYYLDFRQHKFTLVSHSSNIIERYGSIFIQISCQNVLSIHTVSLVEESQLNVHPSSMLMLRTYL